MCGGLVAALIYDFLQFPQLRNFRTRLNVLRNGAEDENDAADLSTEGIARPGPSQWPKE